MRLLHLSIEQQKSLFLQINIRMCWSISISCLQWYVIPNYLQCVANSPKLYIFANKLSSEVERVCCKSEEDWSRLFSEPGYIRLFSCAVIAVWWRLSLSTAQSELETDEVVPRLLYGQEAHLHSYTPRHRGRRSVDAPREGRYDPENIILLLPAFGSNLYLNLTRDSTFLSRDFVVEERLRDQRAVVNRLSETQLCFYSGSIINHTDSLASVSTCSGLVIPSLFFWTCWCVSYYSIWSNEEPGGTRANWPCKTSVTLWSSSEAWLCHQSLLLLWNPTDLIVGQSVQSQSAAWH